VERKELRSARLDKHWTLAQAAEHLEVDINTLSRWERGKTRPHGYNIAKICEVYERTSAELGLDQKQEETDPAEALLAVPPSLSFPNEPTPDRGADPPQQAEISGSPTAPVFSTFPGDSPHISPPPLPPRRRLPRYFGGILRGALLLILLAIIATSAGIWCNLHGLGKKQQAFSRREATALPSPEQGTTLETASATPTGTVGRNPSSASRSGTKTPVPPSGTPSSGTPPSGASSPGASSSGASEGGPGPTATPASDCLNGSASSFKFTSVLGLGNISPGVLVLTNCGGPTQDWFASVATNDGGNWLNASPSTGTIAVNQRENVQVQATKTGLQVGVYQGSITFTKGSSFWVVSVTLTIVQA